MTNYRIWYSRDPQFREDPYADWRRVPVTHVAVREIKAKNLNDAYRIQQAENWSPNGEARGLIRSLGLHHTSMSVGDVIEDLDEILEPGGTGVFYEVGKIGFNMF